MANFNLALFAKVKFELLKLQLDLCHWSARFWNGVDCTLVYFLPKKKIMSSVC